MACTSIELYWNNTHSQKSFSSVACVLTQWWCDQLLPLEMYLEEGIPLVMYIRNRPFVETVELPVLSTHAFLTFNSASSQLPAFKVWKFQTWMSSSK